MPNVTFSSPKIKKDVTVYAAAGNRKTILGVAKEHGIEIDCECEKGECGSCTVEVIHIGNKPPMGVHLTEKEKHVLLTSGKLKKKDFEELELLGLAPRYRLARFGGPFFMGKWRRGSFLQVLVACWLSRWCCARLRAFFTPECETRRETSSRVPW